jgi:hypothetical protein
MLVAKLSKKRLKYVRSKEDVKASHVRGGNASNATQEADTSKMYQEASEIRTS